LPEILFSPLTPLSYMKMVAMQSHTFMNSNDATWALSSIKRLSDFFGSASFVYEALCRSYRVDGIKIAEHADKKNEQEGLAVERPPKIAAARGSREEQANS